MQITIENENGEIQMAPAIPYTTISSPCSLASDHDDILGEHSTSIASFHKEVRNNQNNNNNNHMLATYNNNEQSVQQWNKSPVDLRRMFIDSLCIPSHNTALQGGLKVKTRSVASVRTPSNRQLSLQSNTDRKLTTFDGGGDNEHEDEDNEIVEEEVVLCSDVIQNILMFLDLPSVLDFRLVNHQSYHLATHNVPYWQMVAQSKFQQVVSLDTTTAFQQLVHMFQEHRRNVKRCRINLQVVEQIGVVQQLFRMVYGMLCPILLSFGLTMVSLLWPLIMDQTIKYSQSIMRMLFIPVVLLVLVPYFLILSLYFIDAFVLTRIKKNCIEHGLPPNVKRSYFMVENSAMKDKRARHLLWTSIFAFCGVPLQITAFFIYYMAPFSYLSPFCIPQYVATLAFLLGDVMSYWRIYRFVRVQPQPVQKRRIYGLVLLVQTLGIIFNVMFCVQIGLVAAKIDGLISYKMGTGKWLVLFVPSWIFCTCLFVGTIIFSILLWRKGKRSVTSIVVFFGIIVLNFIFAFTSLGLVLLGLRLDGELASPYFVITIPIFFGVMITVPVTLFLSIALCLFMYGKRLNF